MSKFRVFLVNNNILSHFKQYFKGKHKDVSPYRNNIILQEWGVSLSNLTSSSYIVIGHFFDARKHLCELSMFELSNLINYNKTNHIKIKCILLE